MSHNRLKGKKIFWTINMITMFFGGGLIPYFMLIVNMGLYDSFLSISFRHCIPFIT
ncbi:MAG: hypothetical protein ACLRSW_16200 [Christensenellaceae bacterium]